MIKVNEEQKIYIYTEPTDMRKAIDGLSLILLEQFEQNPQSGDLYLFINRARNKIKCLCWDKNGFVLYYKRLERGRFNYSKYLNDNRIIITEKQLRALLMGLDFYMLGNYSEEKYDDFF